MEGERPVSGQDLGTNGSQVPLGPPFYTQMTDSNVDQLQLSFPHLGF